MYTHVSLTHLLIIVKLRIAIILSNSPKYLFSFIQNIKSNLSFVQLMLDHNIYADIYLLSANVERH